MAQHTLSSGIIIKDNRDINCGIQIEKQYLFSMQIEHSAKNGFYIHVFNGYWIKNEIVYFQAELKEAVKNLHECEKIFNPKQK